MTALPFLYFIPDENAYYDFKRYASDGTEIHTQMNPLAILSERKDGNEITRGLTDEEKTGLNNSSKKNVT
jgi:hypothetical protein